MVNLFKNFLLSLGRRSLCSELWSWVALQRSLPLSRPILFRQTPAVSDILFPIGCKHPQTIPAAAISASRNHLRQFTLSLSPFYRMYYLLYFSRFQSNKLCITRVHLTTSQSLNWTRTDNEIPFRLVEFLHDHAQPVKLVSTVFTPKPDSAHQLIALQDNRFPC